MISDFCFFLFVRIDGCICSLYFFYGSRDHKFYHTTMRSLFYKAHIIEYVRQNRAEKNSSSHFERSMSDSFFEWDFFFFLEYGLQLCPEIIDIMCMLSGFVSEIHSIVGKQHTKRKCHSKQYASKSILKSNQHSHTTRKSAMKRRETAGSENMPGINTLVSDDIDDNLGKLDDTSDDYYKKNRFHLESLREILSNCANRVVYHQKYAKIKFSLYVMKKWQNSNVIRLLEDWGIEI